MRRTPVPMRRLLAAALFATLVVWTPIAALAQSVQAPTREEVLRNQLDERLKTQGQPVGVEGGIERAPCPLADPKFAALRFTLSEARFDGVEAIDGSILRESYGDLVGRELQVSAICEIRDRATTILRDAGYLVAIQVPAQTIESGIVAFKVVFARLLSVQVRGDAGANAGTLRRYIAKIERDPVFNIKRAERYLLLARDIPGLDVRLTLRPASRKAGGQDGDIVGIFDVVRTPVYADINVQNFGSKATGRFGGMARVRLNGLTGLADQTTLTAFSTFDFREQHIFQGGHEFGLGSEGLRLGAGLTYALTKPDVPGSNDFDSTTLVGTFYARYPFIRSQTSNLLGTVGLDIVDQDTDFLDLPLSRDRLRVAFARLDFNLVDRASTLGRNGYTALEPKFAVAGSIELRQGFSGLGASKGCGTGLLLCLNPAVIPPSRLDSDASAFVIRASAQADFRPTPLLKLSFKPRMQYSPDALMAYEEISGGNYTVGRGYDPGAVAGDSGIGIQAEIAYGSLIPERPDAVALQPFAFVDHMAVWNKNFASDPQEITAVGGGLRATIARQASIEAIGAIPLKRAPLQTRKTDARFLVSLTVQLAPWYGR